MRTFFLIIILSVLFVAVADILELRRCRRGKGKILLSLLVILTSLPLPLLLVFPFLLRSYTPVSLKVQAFVLASFVIFTFVKAVFYLPYLCSGRRKWGTAAGAAVAVCLFFSFMTGMFVTPNDIRVQSVDVGSSRLPEPFDGYTVALFSDIHLGTMINPERECTAVADTLGSLDADLAVFCGDLVNICHHELTPEVMNALRKIRTRDGVIAVQGNHDTGTYIRDSLSVFPCATADSVISRVSQMGWKMLRDSTLYIRRGNDSLSVTGIGYTETLQEYKHVARLPREYDPSPIYDSVPVSLFNITVSHLPHLWPRIVETPYGDLTLSGHVHACQMKFNLFGKILSPAAWMYDNWSGLYSESGKYLYVNDGIGCAGMRMRLGARPEITLIRIHHIE